MKKVIIMLFSFSMFLSCNSQTKKIDEKIIGVWKGNLIDSDSKKNIEKLTMEFVSDGKLIYKVGEGSSQNTIKMDYWTEDNILFSKEIDSKEKEDKATYRFDNDKLILDFEGQTIIFTKEK